MRGFGDTLAAAGLAPLDWAIVAAVLAALVLGALRTRRYTRSVAAFMAAERCGGRYLIAVADNMAQLGVISLVWYFEQNYEVGFTSIWWTLLEGPALIVMALSGWVIYRFRQTRAMTLAQFFERRYSRRFRVFAGLVAYLAGIINFGIFPAVGARFFIALCGLPDQLTVAGLEVGTYPVLMALLLSISIAFLFLGGQIAVMVTDFLQGVVCNVTFIVLIVFLLITFSWDQISEVLLTVDAGRSMVNPFDLGKEQHFDAWYYVIGVVILFYCAKGWQGTQGYNCSAYNAHEAKMAYILSQWRFRVLMLIVVILPICVRTFLEHPAYADQSADVTTVLAGVEGPNDDVRAAIRNQIRTPLAMRAILPAGLLGLACAAMLGAFISTHDTYLHSWGTILIQDVILPFRKRPFSTRQHLWLLRGSIFAVAAFIFAFSIWYEPSEYIAMFLAITGAIFVGGAGAAIIGGLYWKRGTTPAAWAAMITGMVLSLAKVLVERIEMETINTALAGPLGNALLLVKDKLTGQEMTFVAIAASTSVYILVSLLGPRRIHNMDRLLHRGRYAVEGETTTTYADARTIWEKLGFTRDFTGGDRIVTYITLAWPLVWTVIFFVVTGYYLAVGISDKSWLAYWHGWAWFILACGTAVTVWFIIGGLRDLREMTRRLKARAADVTDDGREIQNNSRDSEDTDPCSA